MIATEPQLEYIILACEYCVCSTPLSGEITVYMLEHLGCVCFQCTNGITFGLYIHQKCPSLPKLYAACFSFYTVSLVSEDPPPPVANTVRFSCTFCATSKSW